MGRRPLNRPKPSSPQDEKLRWVKAAIPAWWEWPRELRRAYVLLESHGASEAGLESIARSLSLDFKFIKDLIVKTPSFAEAVDYYVTNGQYPNAKMNEPLRLSELLWLFNNESAVLYLVAFEQDVSKGKIGANHAAKMISEAGFAGQVETVSSDDTANPAAAPISGLTTFEDMELEDEPPDPEPVDEVAEQIKKRRRDVSDFRYGKDFEFDAIEDEAERKAEMAEMDAAGI
jgi:hypothetical protein